MSRISERRLAEIFDCSHTGLQKAREAGRLFRGIDLDFYADYDAGGNFLGYNCDILEDLGCRDAMVKTDVLAQKTGVATELPRLATMEAEPVATSLVPVATRDVASVDVRSQVVVESAWPWATTVEDVVRGKPCFGGLYRYDRSNRLVWLDYVPAFKPQPLQEYLSQKSSSFYYRSAELLLDTIDDKGRPLALEFVVAVDGQRVVIGFLNQP